MVLAKPTDDEIKSKILEVLPRIDIDSMGMKAFIQLLSKEMGDVDLKPRKEFIKQALTEAINEKNEQEEDDEQESSDEEDEEEAPATKKKKGGGLSQSKEISDKLAAFLGKGKMMARTDVVKSLWAYIREHDLQNPSNKREIVLDDAMRDVFGCDRFTMFTMNKYVGAHIHPFKPVDLTSTTASRRSATLKKRDTKKRKGKTAGNVKKKRKTGSQPPYRLSSELQDIVGTDILPRPQVVSKIWTYIKANNLQNENDKREIICDDKLIKIIKKPKISMFQMNACISEHLIEKLDKSAYHHEESDGDDDEEAQEDEEEDDNASESE
jgi:upstream activation factor subunit UAF30